MGFRSLFITQAVGPDISPWFIQKWGEWFNFDKTHDGKLCFPISSPIERKMYQSREGSEKDFFNEFHEDLQQLLKDENEPGYDRNIVVIWLHECDGMTRVDIRRDRILLSEPDSWENVKEPSHHYCMGCDAHPQIVHEKTWCHCGCLTHYGASPEHQQCAKCDKRWEEKCSLLDN